MASHLRSETLFRSPLVVVSDVVCRPDCQRCGAEEEASTHGLVFPRAGLFIKQRTQQEQIVADPMRVLFFNRHECYRVAHPVAGGDDCTSVSFDENALVDFLREIDPAVADSPARPFRASAAPSSSALCLRLQQLRQTLRGPVRPDPLAIEEACGALLAESVTGSRRESNLSPPPIRAETRRAHQNLAAAVRVVLARRCRERLSLAELARAVFSSPFHLARIFRRETGLSLHAYRNHLRLRLALNQLHQGRDLTMLALELGFASHAHFTHAFRGAFGCAPSQLRATRKSFAHLRPAL